MATRSTIWIQREEGLEGIYSHWDGYLDNNGALLYEHYNTEEKVNELIANGDIRSLENTIGNTDFYNTDSANYKVESLDATARYAEKYNYIFSNGTWYFYEDYESNNVKFLAPNLI